MSIRWLLAGLLTFGTAACGGARDAATTADPPAGGTLSEGEMMVERGEFEQAKVLFQGIVDQSPDSPKAHYYLALTQSKTGDTEGALSHYEKAIALDQKLMDAHINLGLLHMALGNLARAEEELKIYLDASPDAADAHFNYGLIQEKMGKLDAAKSHYEQAARINPEDPEPLFGLGELARKQGNHQEAVSLYEQARDLNPELPDIVFAEGVALLALDEAARACTLYKSLLEMSSPDLRIVSEAGRAIAKADKACAVDLYRGAISLEDGYAVAHFYLANALAREKQFDEAAAHFERFIELAPGHKAAQTAKKSLEVCRAQGKP